jgi:hypothetical protein
MDVNLSLVSQMPKAKVYADLDPSQS